MSRPLRILHTADSHIGAELPVRPRDDRPRRGDDFVDSFSRVLDHALNENVDLVIHAGDLFDLPNPSSRTLVATGEPLLGLAASGVPVIIVPGNQSDRRYRRTCSCRIGTFTS